MTRIVCKNCGGAHPVWDCKRPAKEWGWLHSHETPEVPASLGNVREGHPDRSGGNSSPANAGPVRVEMAWGQKRIVRGGGPERAPGAEIPLTKPAFDKKAWMRSKMPAYMRQYRADVKAGIRIPKPKASKDRSIS